MWKLIYTQLAKVAALVFTVLTSKTNSYLDVAARTTKFQEDNRKATKSYMLVYYIRLTVLILRQESQLTLHLCALCTVFVTAFKEEVLNTTSGKPKIQKKILTSRIKIILNYQHEFLSLLLTYFLPACSFYFSRYQHSFSTQLCCSTE